MEPYNFKEDEYNWRNYYNLRVMVILSKEENRIVEELYRSNDYSNLIIAIEIIKSKFNERSI